MEENIVVSSLLYVMFWVLVFVEMAIATTFFCLGNRDYEDGVRRLGVSATNRFLWLFGFLSMGVPVLQVGLLMGGAMTLAWAVVIGTLVLWLLAVCMVVVDR